MLYAAKSHIGLVRTMNQDGFVILPELKGYQMYLVADGMGGPSAGDVASRLAVEAIRAYVLAHLQPDSDVMEVLLAAIHTANEAIYRQASETPAYTGMGTTVVCALADEAKVHFAHVGDSRGYLLSDGALRQVTKDHSLVAELVRRGQLTTEEAKTHPQRNIMTRAVGTEPVSQPDIDTVDWRKGDVLLLCSDGLTNYVEDEEIAGFARRASQCQREESLSALVEEMIELVLTRGGSDNVTVIVGVHNEERDVI